MLGASAKVDAPFLYVERYINTKHRKVTLLQIAKKNRANINEYGLSNVSSCNGVQTGAIMQKCAALMVDIRDSRKMPEERRQDVQDVIAASVAYLNALFQRDLLCEVVFSAGDEVQGLFFNAAAAYLYYRALSLLVLQADLRGGVGCGTWDVRVEGAPSTAQDGTAYHHARDAIAYAKKSRLYDFALSSSDPSSLHTVMANYPFSLSRRRTMRQAKLAREVELRFPIALHVDDGARDRARARLLELLAVIERVEERAEPFDADAYLQQAVSVADLDEAGVLALPSQLSGLSYRMEEGAGRTRQSIDRLLDGAMVNQERVAAAAVALSLLEEEAGGNRG